MWAHIIRDALQVILTNWRTIQMQKIPQYLDIGIRRYKTQKHNKNTYSVWECKDICSLRYIGEWTKTQLIKCWEREELV